MAKTLQEYADWLEERSEMRWPKPPPIEPPKATPFLKPLSGVRAVVWNVYGTLLRIDEGDLRFEVSDEFRMQIALEKMDGEFNMWNSMYRKPVAPWKYLLEQYQKILQKQRMVATKIKGDVPEVQSPQVWRQIFAQLQEKEYKYDTGLYGDMDQLSEKAAYFFHASLQGVEAAPNALAALNTVAGLHLSQGILADGQAFTLLQLLRELKAQGPVPPLPNLFRAQLMLFSYQAGVRKPSKTLFQTFLQQAREIGLSAKDMLYISSGLDSDLAAAKSLGMQTALYAGDKLSLRATKQEIGNPKLRPDRLLTDLAQVGELLNQ